MSTPGIQIELTESSAPSPLVTGVPAFVARVSTPGLPLTVTQGSLPAAMATVRARLGAGSALEVAVRGFFENDGAWCRVAWLDAGKSVEEELDKALLEDSAIDLVCAPVLADDSRDLKGTTELQAELLSFCARRQDCFALLDAPAGLNGAELVKHRDAVLRRAGAEAGASGALYFPRIGISNDERPIFPPCGHVAGVYARVDRRTGPFRAPANEVLEGVVELAATPDDPGALNEGGINCLRAMTGRGIRIWGSRTLSQHPAWRHVTARRLIFTLRRWLQQALAWVTFEVSEPRLWLRVTRQLNGHLEQLFQQGALRGDTPQAAFYVKCDEENNPPAVRDSGQLVVEVGVAPLAPRELIVIKLVRERGALVPELSAAG